VVFYRTHRVIAHASAGSRSADLPWMPPDVNVWQDAVHMPALPTSRPDQRWGPSFKWRDEIVLGLAPRRAPWSPSFRLWVYIAGELRRRTALNKCKRTPRRGAALETLADLFISYPF